MNDFLMTEEERYNDLFSNLNGWHKFTQFKISRNCWLSVNLEIIKFDCCAVRTPDNGATIVIRCFNKRAADKIKLILLGYNLATMKN